MNTNLDCMDESDLVAFAVIYEGRPSRNAAQSLVGHRPRYLKIAANLGHYARNRAVAMQCRKRGDITGAGIYETICDQIYSRLPDDLKW